VLIFLVIAVVVLAAVAGGVVLAGRSRKEFKDANVVVPGRPTPAPGSWAGSHDPEARLHRRRRDAMTALRANQSFDDDGGLLDLRVDLEQQALALDERLVAVAALPEASKGQALFDIESAVAMVESAVASLATRSVGEVRPQVERAVDRVDERTSMLEQVRAQLEALPATTPPAPPLRIVRDETAQVQSRPPAATPEPTSSPSPPRPPAASPAKPPPASRPPAAPQGPRQPPRPPRPGPTGGA
jgi:hypothetical protein